MDEHLREVGAVRLVLRLREHELDGADDAGVVLGDEQRPPPGLDVGSDAPPERMRALGLERVEEADARAAVDRVDQQLGETRDLGVVDSLQAPDLDPRRPAHQRHHRDPRRRLTYSYIGI